MNRDEIIRLFSLPIRKALSRLDFDFREVYEIRLRVHAPLLLVYQGREYYLGPCGLQTGDEQGVYRVTQEDIRQSLEYIAGYSLYAYEEEMRQGFLTVQGGHRVGIAGQAILDGEKIRNLRFISYINVRLAHQVKGCAREVMPYLYHGDRVYDTLVISPPGCGKTTLLRDMIRQVSNGCEGHAGQTVGVVDERSEIAGSYQGVPQNDVGIRTDVLDCCPKTEGMRMLLRSMSPSVVAVDEIGDCGDVKAIEEVVHSGCTLMATVHGSSLEDIMEKPLFRHLTEEKIFRRYILLHAAPRAGVIRGIFDETGVSLWPENSCPC